MSKDFYRYIFRLYKIRESKDGADIVKKLLIIIHPACILYALYNCLSKQTSKNTFGIALLGISIGLALLRLIIRYSIEMQGRWAAVFLLAPVLLVLISFINDKNIVIQPRSNLIWLCFVMVYLISGTLLFVQSHRAKWEALIVTFFAPTLLFFLFVSCLCREPSFSPDSYSYYDISQHLFTGLVSTIRQYVIFTDLNISFPYLYPSFIAVIDELIGFGIYSGIIINGLAAFFTMFLLMRGTKRLCGSSIPGMLTTFFLFSNADYINELMAARSIPFTILILILLFNVIAKVKELSKKDIFFMGLFAGAGMVTRFDFIVVAGLTGASLFLIFKKRSPQMFVMYAFGLSVFTLPWILYSLFNFHTMWITDNRNTLFLAQAYNPQRFFLPIETIPTLFNNKEAWLNKVKGNFESISSGVFSCFIKSQNLLLLGFIVTGNALSILKNKEKQKETSLLLYGSLIYVIKTIIIIMIGYGDLRYHVETIMMFFLLALCSVYNARKNPKLWIHFATIATVILLIANLAPMLNESFMPKMHQQILSSDINIPQASDVEWAAMLRKDSGKRRNSDIKVFFMGGNPYSVGAMTGLHCYAMLSNATEERLIYLLQNYIEPDYIHVTSNYEDWLNALKTVYILTCIDGTNTYRVGIAK